MKYQVGGVGRIVAVRFEDGEDVFDNINEISRKEKIKNAVFYLIGGIKKGKIVAGPENEELPPKPIWKEIKESNEVLGIGTIFFQDDEPQIHFHGAFGKRDTVQVGCLRGASETFLVIEAIIFELEGIDARREFDKSSGLTLLKL